MSPTKQAIEEIRDTCPGCGTPGTRMLVDEDTTYQFCPTLTCNVLRWNELLTAKVIWEARCGRLFDHQQEAQAHLGLLCPNDPDHQVFPILVTDIALGRAPMMTTPGITAYFATSTRSKLPLPVADGPEFSARYNLPSASQKVAEI